MDNELIQLGLKIGNKRREKNYTQGELAEKLSISNNHLSSLENGRSSPSFKLFKKICIELDLDPGYLMFDDSENIPVSESLIKKINCCDTEQQIFISKIIDIMLNK